ncbi:MAG: tRNA (guanosine(46)-N7)-methyltransferase TrmB [Candidatus Berkiella sp.]
MTEESVIHRPIRSFVVRQGRMTPAQKEAVSSDWPLYGLALPEQGQPYDWNQVFGREAKRVLEIGFGMGATLAKLASENPHADFIGVEVHPPGVGRMLARAKALELTNLKLFAVDAIDVLHRAIKDASLDRVLLLFPDPWPKTKHHKRRIVQPDFVELIASKLKVGGFFHLATDWQPYAEHMMAVLTANERFTNTFGEGLYAPAGFERHTTKFEKRGEKLGHAIWDLIFQLNH